MNKVTIEIKKDQIEITRSDGRYILIRKHESGYIAQFSDEITDADIRRLTGTGVIEIIQNASDHHLYLKTRRFHSTEVLYLIFADLLKNKPINAYGHENKRN